MTGPDALEVMFAPRSVAVVGASPRRGSAGAVALQQLRAGGYRGPIYPVNPRYDAVSNLTCYPDLPSLPDPADLAILALPNAALESQMAVAARSGVRSVVIFASGHEAEPSEHGSLAERLADSARRAGIAVCGGNCMGFADVERGLRALAFPEEDLAPGPITWLSHSGSAFTALLHNDRGLRFNLAVSAGQEFTTTVAEYMLHALRRPSTGLIALFIEAVRDPERFVEALREAEARDVPVVALKVGRRELSRRLVTAHSGALAGSEGAFEALFDAHGVTRVRTLNEMADTLELFSGGRRAAAGGLAAIHDSGGERAHLIDVATDVGVRFANISDETRRALGSTLEPGLPAVNPLDAWGTGNDFNRIFYDCMSALLEDEDTGALAFCVDLKRDDPDSSYVPVAAKVFESTDKPFAVVSNLSSAIDADSAEALRGARVPVLEDTAGGLAAFAHLFARRDHRDLPPLQTPAPVPGDAVGRWRSRLGTGENLSDAESLALVEDYGIPVVATHSAATAEDALGAARAIGFPVAMKSAENLVHKSDAGAVKLDLAEDAGVTRAYADLATRFGPRVSVQAMAEKGVELALGLVDDEQFGTLMVVGAGGALVELLDDRALALPPLDAPRAGRLLDKLAVPRVLGGVRGARPADLDAVIQAVVRLSRLALDVGDLIEALDVNPLICTPTGCVAVDALVVLPSG